MRSWNFYLTESFLIRTENKMCGAVFITKCNCGAFFKLIFVLSAFVGLGEATGRTICKRLKQPPVTETVLAELKETYSERCPLTTASLSVYDVKLEESSQDHKQRLLICWSPEVWRFSIQFDTSVLISDVTPLPGNLIHTCDRSHDTVYVGHKQMRRKGVSKLLLSLPTNVTTTGFRVFEDLNVKRGQRLPRYIQYSMHDDGPLERNHNHIKKRSVIEEDNVTKPSECGKSRSCYRYGSADCGHFECEYYLSYTAIDGMVHIEMSAKASGWVAVGFSSDKRMGGDEVIACHRERPMSDTFVAGTFVNPYRNDRPTKKSADEVVTLIESIEKDGYIYCRLTRPTSADDHQDLTNDWFQLYAFGPVLHSGGLDKHSRTPTVSDKKITVLQVQSVQTSGATYIQPTNVVCFLMLLICALQTL